MSNTATFLTSLFVVYFVYWHGGGNFERGPALGLTSAFGIFLAAINTGAYREYKRINKKEADLR